MLALRHPELILLVTTHSSSALLLPVGVLSQRKQVYWDRAPRLVHCIHEPTIVIKKNKVEHFWVRVEADRISNRMALITSFLFDPSHFCL
jgi:hypothetical protein